jgi:hypothetical protein
MEKKIDYDMLYSLQDKILDIIVKLENDFYLTGGISLHLNFLKTCVDKRAHLKALSGFFLLI